jgi:hypothetical protein
MTDAAATIIGQGNPTVALACMNTKARLHALWRREGAGLHLSQDYRRELIAEASEQLMNGKRNANPGNESDFALSSHNIPTRHLPSGHVINGPNRGEIRMAEEKKPESIIATPTTEISAAELPVAFSGSAVNSNKFYVTGLSNGMRIAFCEGVPDIPVQFRTAVMLAYPDAISLRDLLTVTLKDIEAHIRASEAARQKAAGGSGA